MCRLILVSLAFLFSTHSICADWGSFFKGYVEQANEIERQKAVQRNRELERQRLELERQNQERMWELEMQRLEIERQRARAQQEMALSIEQDRQAKFREQQRVEQERRSEELRREHEAREAYRRGTSGSGFFVSRHGHIVTNAHVIGNYSFLLAKDTKGRLYELDIIAIDKQSDLALLRAAAKSEGLPVVSADTVSKGLRVYAIGFPQPAIQGAESKITDGIISSMTGLFNNGETFQISVPVQGGNSGGPLVTEKGAVIGVVVATVNPAVFARITGDLPQNVNFAVKTEVLERFLAANGVKPLRLGKRSTPNPIGFADDNTVMIAAKPEPFLLAAAPPPSGKRTSTQAEDRAVPAPTPMPAPSQPMQRVEPNVIVSVPESEARTSLAPAEVPQREGEQSVRCKLGDLAPVQTTRRKCQIVSGREVL